MCDPCWQNNCERAQSSFELQAKEVKKFNFGGI